MTITKEKKRELKKKGKHLEPIVRVGKNGLTENAVEQVRKVLKKQELIKIRFLRSFIEQKDRKEAAEELAERLKAELIDQTGFNTVIYKKKSE